MSGTKTAWLTAVWLATAIFLSALLLFLVQPLIGRFLLPWFGGMPEVWTACMLFFQSALLIGYAYADWLVRLPLRWQAIVHTLAAALAALSLRIIPPDSFKPTPLDMPVWQILKICMMSVGGAFVFLSASSPLLQRWAVLRQPHSNPYRLYALSNAGSLLALFCFPFLLEPLMSRQRIAIAWQGTFWVCAALLAGLAWYMVAYKACASPTPRHGRSYLASNLDKIRFTARLLWLALPMCGSVLLLATTNKITMDIAVVPFLWTLPLALYLISFIVCFEYPKFYHRTSWLAVLIAAMMGHVWLGRNAEQISVWLIVAVYSLMLLAGCMICHGELYHRRPVAQYLTAYYLCIASGGALGGGFAALIAPLIFRQYHELHLAVLAAVLIAVMCRQDVSAAFARRRPFWAVALCLIGLGGIYWHDLRAQENEKVLIRQRNFFGVLTILEQTGAHPADDKRWMQHGTTYHGLQFLQPAKRHLPTGYYDPDSGIGLLLTSLQDRPPLKIGIVGLGVGTLAAYGRDGDRYDFYEINPAVKRLAYEYFTFLADSRAKIEILLGDARLTMERQLPQQYDVLVLDAFSSDAIPTHLLTAQAFEIFLRHLQPDGVLAVHLSTRYLNLKPIIWKLAEHFQLQTIWIESFGSDRLGALASDWLLLSRNATSLQIPALQARQSRKPDHLGSVPLWTDDYTPLLALLKKER